MVTVVVTGCHVPQELVFASAMLELAAMVARAARRILNVWFGFYYAGLLEQTGGLVRLVFVGGPTKSKVNSPFRLWLSMKECLWSGLEVASN